MDTARAIAFNTAIQLLAKVVTAGTSLVVIAYVTRYLGVGGYGDYATIFAYLGIFSVFVDLGLFVTTVREIAKDSSREREILGNMLALRLVVGVAVFAIAYALALALPYSGLVRWGILIGSISYWFMNLNQAPLSLFQSRLTMQKAAIADIVGRFALLALVMWFISLKLGLLWIVAATSAGSAVVCILSLIMASWVVPMVPIFHWPTWRRMLVAAIPMGVVMILATIYFRIDVVMLSVMKGSFDVGIYSAPYKILEVLLAVPSIFMSSVLPVMSRALVNSRDTAHTIFRKGFDFLSVVALPFVVGGVVVGTPIMVLVAGPDFSLSGPALSVLVLALGAAFLNSATVYTLVAANQQNRLLWPYVAAVVFNVATNWLVIPKFSYMGAAVTTVLTELLVFGAAMYLTVRYLRFTPTWSVFSKALLASLVMGGIIWYWHHLAVWWLIIIGGAVYATVLFLTRAVTKSDLAELMPQFKR